MFNKLHKRAQKKSLQPCRMPFSRSWEPKKSRQKNNLPPRTRIASRSRRMTSNSRFASWPASLVDERVRWQSVASRAGGSIPSIIVVIFVVSFVFGFCFLSIPGQKRRPSRSVTAPSNYLRTRVISAFSARQNSFRGRESSRVA
jgi:hypothetical protein